MTVALRPETVHMDVTVPLGPRTLLLPWSQDFQHSTQGPTAHQKGCMGHSLPTRLGRDEAAGFANFAELQTGGPTLKMAGSQEVTSVERE